MKDYDVFEAITENTIRTRFKRKRYDMKRCTTLLKQQQRDIKQQEQEIKQRERRIKTAEIDEYRQGSIIYTNGELFQGEVTVTDQVDTKNMWGFLTCDGYSRARRLHCSIDEDIKRSREKPKVDGVPHDAMQTRLELESKHGL